MSILEKSTRGFRSRTPSGLPLGSICGSLTYPRSFCGVGMMRPVSSKALRQTGDDQASLTSCLSTGGTYEEPNCFVGVLRTNPQSTTTCSVSRSISSVTPANERPYLWQIRSQALFSLNWDWNRRNESFSSSFVLLAISSRWFGLLSESDRLYATPF